MFKFIKEKLIEVGLTAEDNERINAAVQHLNSVGYDEWGLDPKTLKAAIVLLRKIYQNYFRVEVSGVNNIPNGRCLLIGNHGGQLPIDAMMIGLSVLFESHPPRIVRAMVERWVPTLPFVSIFFTRCGQVVGDTRNCRDLLNNNQCVLVFPEGVKGSGKTIFKRYELQTFGDGFLRLALETRSPIVPVAVIGCEEAYPSVFNFEKLAKLMKAPYFPVTPLFPLLGPLGALPLPTKVTIRFGEPIIFEDDPDVNDSRVAEMVKRVKQELRKEIKIGLEKRGDKIFTGVGK